MLRFFRKNSKSCHPERSATDGERSEPVKECVVEGPRGSSATPCRFKAFSPAAVRIRSAGGRLYWVCAQPGASSRVSCAPPSRAGHSDCPFLLPSGALLQKAPRDGKTTCQTLAKAIASNLTPSP